MVSPKNPTFNILFRCSVLWRLIEQELSYHKQIARQLRTQYADGIYINPVTFKFRLTVTQGHWKQEC